jgi:hypothetical protein
MSRPEQSIVYVAWRRRRRDMSAGWISGPSGTDRVDLQARLLLSLDGPESVYDLAILPVGTHPDPQPWQ